MTAEPRSEKDVFKADESKVLPAPPTRSSSLRSGKASTSSVFRSPSIRTASRPRTPPYTHETPPLTLRQSPSMKALSLVPTTSILGTLTQPPDFPPPPIPTSTPSTPRSSPLQGPVNGFRQSVRRSPSIEVGLYPGPTGDRSSLTGSSSEGGAGPGERNGEAFPFPVETRRPSIRRRKSSVNGNDAVAVQRAIIKKLEEKDAQIVDIQDQLRTYEVELKARDDLASTLEVALSDSERDLRKARLMIDDLRIERDQFQARNQSLVENFDLLQKEVEDSKQKFTEMERELLRLKDLELERNRMRRAGIRDGAKEDMEKDSDAGGTKGSLSKFRCF